MGWATCSECDTRTYTPYEDDYICRWCKFEQNPVYTDMLGQPITVGDTIAWPTSAGRAVGMSVGVITNIKDLDRGKSSASTKTFTLSAKPLKAAYAGHYYSAGKMVTDEATGERKYVRDYDNVKPVNIQKVQNVIKIDLPESDA